MSDREAFVAAIAANPHDDLPRLVFADWLDEHGDPERAEFIRTQIRWHHADADERTQLDQRAEELFREHWMRWLQPFLLSLNPHTDSVPYYQFQDDGQVARRTLLASKKIGRSGPPLIATTHVEIGRGFVSAFEVELSMWVPRASLVDALRQEPPHAIRVTLDDDTWDRFTHPVLRRVYDLGLVVNQLTPATLFHDPHLAGVRQLTLANRGTSPADPHPLPPALIVLFSRSPLAYRVSGLELPCVYEDGIEALCRSDRMRLDRLALGGSLNTDCVRRLERAGFAETVGDLNLRAAALLDAGGAALARGAWRKLTHLTLTYNSLTAAVLPALASAAFIPQLKTLDLSHNPLFDGTDLSGLQRLADALDPDRLEHLDLTDTGLSHVPEFLGERFGERVTV